MSVKRDILQIVEQVDLLVHVMDHYKFVSVMLEEKDKLLIQNMNQAIESWKQTPTC